MDAVLRRHEPIRIATGLRLQLELPQQVDQPTANRLAPESDLRALGRVLRLVGCLRGRSGSPQSALLRPCRRDSSGETLVSTAVGPYSHGGSHGPPSTSRRIAGQLSETGRFSDCRSDPSPSCPKGVQNPCPQSTSHNQPCHRVLRPPAAWDSCSAMPSRPNLAWRTYEQSRHTGRLKLRNWLRPSSSRHRAQTYWFSCAAACLFGREDRPDGRAPSGSSSEENSSRSHLGASSGRSCHTGSPPCSLTTSLRSALSSRYGHHRGT
jgi:hypothetical protein